MPCKDRPNGVHELELFATFDGKVHPRCRLCKEPAPKLREVQHPMRAPIQANVKATNVFDSRKRAAGDDS